VSAERSEWLEQPSQEAVSNRDKTWQKSPSRYNRVCLC